MLVAPVVAPGAEVAPVAAELNIIAFNPRAKSDQRNAAGETNEAGSSESDDVHYFTVEGRRYQLYKKYPGRANNWYVRFNCNKKTHKKCLETNHCGTAVTKATQWIKKIKMGKWADVEKLKARSTSATYGEIETLYLPSEDAPLGLAMISPKSAENNAWAFGKIIKQGLNVKDAAAVSLDKVNEALVEAFEKAMILKYIKDYALEGMTKPEHVRDAKDKALRSARSIVLQARSLFATRKGSLVPKYEQQGLKVPACVESFMKCKLNGKELKREYMPVSDAVITVVFDKVDELRETEPDAFLAFWCATGAGLRRSEIHRLMKEHFIMRDGRPWISGGIGKNGKKIEVPVQARAWTILKPFVENQTGYMLTGSDVPPSFEFARKLNFWMKQKGWNTEKKLHELRAYVGSLIYKESAHEGMLFMRHGSVKTTERYYTKYCGAINTPEVL